MAYEKTTWESGVTLLSPENMNKIEEGIYNNDAGLSTLQANYEALQETVSAMPTTLRPIVRKKEFNFVTPEGGSESNPGAWWATTTVDSVANYTPIGVVGYHTSHSIAWRPTVVRFEGKTLYMYGITTGGKGASGTIAWYVLYVYSG